MHDCVAKFKFDHEYDCCHLFNDSIACAIEVLIAGKSVLMCGCGNVDESCAFDFRDSGVRVFLVDCDPICVLQACLGVLKVAAIESVVSRSAWRAWKGSPRQVKLRVATCRNWNRVAFWQRLVCPCFPT